MEETVDPEEVRELEVNIQFNLWVRPNEQHREVFETVLIIISYLGKKLSEEGRLASDIDLNTLLVDD